MVRWFSLLLVIVLVSCGSAPGAPSTAVPNDSVVAPTAGSVSTAEPTAASAPTTEPTATAASASETSGRDAAFRRGYTTLIYIKAGAIILEEIAQKVQADTDTGFEAFGSLIAAGAILKAVDESLADDTPAPAFTASWSLARDINPRVRDLLARWLDEDIKAADVLAELPALQTDIDRMLDQADGDMSTAYGLDRAELKHFRDEAIADLRARMQATPTPEP